MSNISDSKTKQHQQHQQATLTGHGASGEAKVKSKSAAEKKKKAIRFADSHGQDAYQHALLSRPASQPQAASPTGPGLSASAIRRQRAASDGRCQTQPLYPFETKRIELFEHNDLVARGLKDEVASYAALAAAQPTRPAKRPKAEGTTGKVTWPNGQEYIGAIITPTNGRGRPHGVGYVKLAGQEAWLTTTWKNGELDRSRGGIPHLQMSRIEDHY